MAPLQAETRLKLGASALLAVPAVLLLLLGVAEMVGGEPSGAQHILQAAPLLALIAAGWRYPRAAGLVLFGLVASLFAGWLVFVVLNRDPGDAIVAWVVAGLVLFAPPIIAGWLLLKAGQPGR